MHSTVKGGVRLAMHAASGLIRAMLAENSTGVFRKNRIADGLRLWQAEFHGKMMEVGRVPTFIKDEAFTLNFMMQAVKGWSGARPMDLACQAGCGPCAR